MMTGDAFLDKRVQKYEKWIQKKQISHASKVIPVRESIEAQQWVLPTNQVIELLAKADPIGLTDCLCRSHYKRCDQPVKVCLLLNGEGQKAIESNRARRLSVDGAVQVIKTANQKGLVHLSFYGPGPEFYALCSCCECCCHDLQILKKMKRPDLVVRSDYIAQDQDNACIDCGDCIERCLFDARHMVEDKKVYDPAVCFGCGLCVTSCSVDAIEMIEMKRSKM